MANLYQLERITKDSQGVPYALVIQGADDERQRLKAAINTNSDWNQDFAIDLVFAKNAGSGPIRFLDTHFWDLGRPSAYLAVVSPKFRSLLERFRLPEHRFYNITIGDERNRQSYFLFHLLYDNKKALDFSRTSFRKYKMPKDLITEENDPIFFKGYDDYVAKQKALVVTGCLYESDHYIYHQTWDVVWGTGFRILVNNAVKSAIEAEGLTGIQLPSFEGHKITLQADFMS